MVQKQAQKTKNINARRGFRTKRKNIHRKNRHTHQGKFSCYNYNRITGVSLTIYNFRSSRSSSLRSRPKTQSNKSKKRRSRDSSSSSSSSSSDSDSSTNSSSSEKKLQKRLKEVERVLKEKKKTEKRKSRKKWIQISKYPFLTAVFPFFVHGANLNRNWTATFEYIRLILTK